MFYNSFYKSVIFSGVILAGGAASAKAQTPLVRNPLYDLKPEICEIKLSEINSLEAERSKPVERIDKTYNRMKSLRDEGFLRVKRDHLMENLLSRYPVALPYQELTKIDADPRQILADIVAPCDPFYADRDLSEAKVKQYLEACKLEEVYKADTLRFTKKDNALRLRRALLRLFDSAETGTSREFISVRKPISFELPALDAADKVVNEQGITPISYIPANSPADGRWSAEIYRPLIDARADDVMLRHFIVKDSPPFEVLCRGTQPKEDQSEYAPVAEFVLKTVPFPEQGFPNANVENAVKPASYLARVGDYLDEVKNGYSSPESDKTPNSKASLKLALVKSPTEFSKSSRDGAEVGLANILGEDNDTVNIDATFGFTFTNTHGTAKSRNLRTFSVTPFVGISQSPTEFNFFDQIEEDGVLTFPAAKKQIAFATLSAGLRFDYEHQGPVISSKNGARSGSNHASLVGQRWPRWRLGGSVESLTDNFRFQKGERYTLDMSLPKYFSDLPGFRQRQELLRRKPVEVGEDRFQNSLGIDRILTGWAVEWDVKPTLNLLDWGENGAPFDFTTPTPRDRVTVDALDELLYGFDFELEFLKTNMFGGVLGDSIIKLSLDYSFRDGYEEGLVLSVDPTTGEETLILANAELFKFGAEISHPDFSNLSLGVAFESGEDFSTFAETESLNLTVKAKY